MRQEYVIDRLLFEPGIEATLDLFRGHGLNLVPEQPLVPVRVTRERARLMREEARPVRGCLESR